MDVRHCNGERVGTGGHNRISRAGSIIALTAGPLHSTVSLPPGLGLDSKPGHAKPAHQGCRPEPVPAEDSHAWRNGKSDSGRPNDQARFPATQ